MFKYFWLIVTVKIGKLVEGKDEGLEKRFIHLSRANHTCDNKMSNRTAIYLY